MPVYNGSKYLQESVNSVLKQTFKNFELVCVDDSSTDDSYDILTAMAEKDSRIKVLKKPNGGNVAKSWNYVMPFLKGESIAYMSQDDLMSADNLDKLFARQQETDADCVLPDMEFFYDSGENNSRITGVNGDHDVILTNREAVILSLSWKIHGFALWKSHIVTDEVSAEDSFTNDEFLTRKLFLKSNKIAFCKGIFYYRQDNQMAITKTYGIKNYYTVLTNFRLYALLEENKFEQEIVAKVLYEVYVIYFNKYRQSSLREGIFSEEAFDEIRSMLLKLYLRLPHKKLFYLANFTKSFSRIKMYLVWAMFSNLTIFKNIMSLVSLFDVAKRHFKKLQLVIIYFSVLNMGI